MKYPLADKYQKLHHLIMGPNPLKLQEELLLNHHLAPGSTVMDLGSGNGLTSLLLAKEYGFRVYAADLWSEPQQIQAFFADQGLSADKLTAVHADATALPFAPSFFDAVISIDSYHYFGCDSTYLDSKLLPVIKPGGYLYIAIPGMKKDCHHNLPPELLLSWTAEELETLHDVPYWQNILSQAQGADIISLQEMVSNQECWDDWLQCDNEYAIGDRKAMAAGGGKYLNFIAIVLRKK